MFDLNFLIDTLSLGSLYALISLGLVIVYGILKLVNFAYGELVMVTGYALYTLGTFTSIPWFLVAFVSVLTAALIAALTEVIAFRPVRARSSMAALTTSFAISMLLQNLVLILVSPRARYVPLPSFFSRSVSFLGIVTPLRNLLTIGTAIVLLLLLLILMKFTILGIALRAAADKFSTTRLMGVPANLIITTAFIISGVLAGVVSIFWIGRSAAVDPLIGAAPLQIAFIATVIGGMNSLVGAVVGGYVYGLLFNLLSIFLPNTLINYRDAFMFVIVILFLLLRPEGIIRGHYVEERVG